MRQDAGRTVAVPPGHQSRAFSLFLIESDLQHRGFAIAPDRREPRSVGCEEGGAVELKTPAVDPFRSSPRTIRQDLGRNRRRDEAYGLAPSSFS